MLLTAPLTEDAGSHLAKLSTIIPRGTSKRSFKPSPPRRSSSMLPTTTVTASPCVLFFFSNTRASSCIVSQPPH